MLRIDQRNDTAIITIVWIHGNTNLIGKSENVFRYILIVILIIRPIIRPMKELEQTSTNAS